MAARLLCGQNKCQDLLLRANYGLEGQRLERGYGQILQQVGIIIIISITLIRNSPLMGSFIYDIQLYTYLVRKIGLQKNSDAQYFYVK